MFALRYICPIGMMTWLKTKIISYICIEKKTLGISIQILIKLILEQWYYGQFYFFHYFVLRREFIGLPWSEFDLIFIPQRSVRGGMGWCMISVWLTDWNQVRKGFEGGLGIRTLLGLQVHPKHPQFQGPWLKSRKSNSLDFLWIHW